MRTLPFLKISPSGNTTILLLTSALSPHEQVLVAHELLHPLHLAAEQAGFVNLDAPSLRMAGGEFCINATRALGLALVLENRLPAISSSRSHCDGPAYWRGSALTSGMPQPITLHVTRTTAGYNAAVELCLPGPPPSEALEPGFCLVHLPGISHLLMDAERTPFPENWRMVSAALRRRYGMETYEAAGCVWWRRQGTMLHANPVVAVRHPHTVCYESACGSAALALALTQRRDSRDKSDAPLVIMQPSGMPIDVSLTQDEHELIARVGGPVRCIARGDVYIDAL